MISFLSVEKACVSSKPGQEKGRDGNEEPLMPTSVLAPWFYERERLKSGTLSVGEPFYQRVDTE